MRDEQRTDEIAVDGATLRRWRIEDAPSLARHANNRNVSRNLRDSFPFPYTENDARDFLAEQVEALPVTDFAIEVRGEAVGSVGLRLLSDVSRGTAEIGYWLGEEHWGKGIMTNAVRAVADHAFARFDLVRIEAQVFAWNPASARVLEKAGFTLEGTLRSRVIKDDQTMDALLYALVRAP